MSSLADAPLRERCDSSFKTALGPVLKKGALV